MPREDEVRAAGRLLGEGLAGMVGMVGDTHRAISARVGAALPPVAQPVLAVHDAIADGVFATVAAAHEGIPTAAGAILARLGSPASPAPSETPFGRAALPAVNGLWGDRIASTHTPLAVPMALRVAGADVTLDPGGLSEAFPAATGRLVVFVHGWCEHEGAWWWDGAAGPEGPSYGDRLRLEHGATDVYVRYNSGLRISENGQLLADLLDALVAAWPVPVRRLDLVGHSMGGLVLRSACHEGSTRQAGWVDLVRTVVTLGTPHHGAPLAKGAHAAQWLLRRVPETAPWSRILGARSGGVRDLRHGTIVAEDWREEDDDAWVARRVTDVPFLPNATACFLGATITADPMHAAGRLLGDGIVRTPSALGGPTRGRSRHVTLDLGEVPAIGGVHHVALLNHPAVHALLEQWLGEVAAAPAPQPA